MAKKFRRNHNTRHIKQSKAYTVEEICKTLGKHSGTVYQWFKRGLVTIEGSYPKLVHGSELVAFLEREKAARKVKCSDDEIFCFGCKAARQPEVDSVKVMPSKKRSVALGTICSVCGTKMFKTVSAQTYQKIINSSQALQVRLGRLVGFNQSTYNTQTEEV